MDLFAGMAILLGMDLATFAAVGFLATLFFAKRFELTAKQRREMVVAFTVVGTLVHFVVFALLWILVAFLTMD
jgi:hypothetical protein